MNNARKKKKNRFVFYFKKKNESFSNNVDAFNDVQTAVNNFNVNKKDRKSDNNRFRVNKTNIECYNCHEKSTLLVIALNSNQKIRKKTRIDRRSLDRIDQKKTK